MCPPAHATTRSQESHIDPYPAMSPGTNPSTPSSAPFSPDSSRPLLQGGQASDDEYSPRPTPGLGYFDSPLPSGTGATPEPIHFGPEFPTDNYASSQYSPPLNDVPPQLQHRLTSSLSTHYPRTILQPHPSFTTLHPSPSLHNQHSSQSGSPLLLRANDATLTNSDSGIGGLTGFGGESLEQRPALYQNAGLGVGLGIQPVIGDVDEGNGGRVYAWAGYTGSYRGTIALLSVTFLTLLTATTFPVLAKHYVLFIPLPYLQQRLWNTSTVAALVAGLGSVLNAGFIPTIDMIGRRWLLVRARAGEVVGMGIMQTIAQRGGIANLRYWRKFGSMFIVAVLCSLILPTALSGALVPSTAIITSKTPISYFQFSGSGGWSNLMSLQSCFVDPNICPGTQAPWDILSALSYGLTGFGEYRNGVFLQTSVTRPTSYHQELFKSYLAIPGVINANGVLNSSACLPNFEPTVSARIDRNPNVIFNNGLLNFTTACGLKQTGYAGMVDGWWANGCEDASSGTYTIIFTIVLEPSLQKLFGLNQFTQVFMEIQAFEELIDLTYYTATSGFYAGTACGERTQLNTSEYLSLPTSIISVLRLSSSYDGDGPMWPTITQYTGQGNTSAIENMITAGLAASANIASESVRNGLDAQIRQLQYPNQQIEPAKLSNTIAEVRYLAYSWALGWKAEAWTLVLALITLVCAFGLIMGTCREQPVLDPSKVTHNIQMGYETGFERGILEGSGKLVGHSTSVDVRKTTKWRLLAKGKRGNIGFVEEDSLLHTQTRGSHEMRSIQPPHPPYSDRGVGLDGSY